MPLTLMGAMMSRNALSEIIHGHDVTRSVREGIITHSLADASGDIAARCSPQ